MVCCVPSLSCTIKLSVWLDLVYSEQYNYNLSEVIPGLYQEYADVHPVNCDRGGNAGGNKINSKAHWEVSIPHHWMSGKCFTYKSVLDQLGSL